MEAVRRFLHWLLDPPEPPCAPSVSDEDEASEKAKWRSAIHGNRGAISRTDAAAQQTTREILKDKESLTGAEKILDDIIRKVERAREGRKEGE